MNKMVLKEVLELLHQMLEEYETAYHFIISMDTAPQHIFPETWKQLESLGLPFFLLCIEDDLVAAALGHARLF